MFLRAAVHAQLQEEERSVAEALEATADGLSQEAHIARQRLQRLAGLCGHNLAQLDPAEVRPYSCQPCSSNCH